MQVTNATSLRVELYVEGESGEPERATAGQEGQSASLGPGSTLEVPGDVVRLTLDVREHGTPSLTLWRSRDESITGVPLGDPTLTDPDLPAVSGLGDPTLTDPDLPAVSDLGDPTLTDPDSRK